MPTGVMRPCAEPRCSALVQSGRCPTHRRSTDIRRGSRQERGYTRQWEHASRQFRQQFPLCGMRPNNQRPVMSECHDKGYVTRAEQTDHVAPHKGNQALFWDSEHNWQSLCRKCHIKKTMAGL